MWKLEIVAPVEVIVMHCFTLLRHLRTASREVSLYALLEVAPTASASEIKHAFRQVQDRRCVHAQYLMPVFRVAFIDPLPICEMLV